VALRNSRAKLGHNLPPGKLIGYARVSTKEQELRVQLDDLEKAGCWNIYKEHASASKRRKRPQLELALMDLRPGDTLVVWRLDRFARNMRELYELLDRVHEAGAGFKSLKETIDMSTAVGRMLLGIFGVLAQFEAELTAERTGAGIAALKAHGGSYGAKPKLSEKRAKRMVAEKKAGATKAALAIKYGLSPASVTNYINRAKKRRRKAT